MDKSVNVFDEPLIACGHDPVTGYFRDGCCNTSGRDAGSHTVCTVLTQMFLEFSQAQGNDLITPRPEYGFAGLKDGDRWCLCASRWLESHKHGSAPRVQLQATHKRALEIVPLNILLPYALDVS